MRICFGLILIMYVTGYANLSKPRWSGIRNMAGVSVKIDAGLNENMFRASYYARKFGVMACLWAGNYGGMDMGKDIAK